MHAAPTSLYIHVPFCVVKCGYCDFNSFAVDDPTVHDRFLSALDRELAEHPLPGPPPSVFIGGGTPTYLDEGRFTRLLDVVARHVDLHACPEVTIEANPESVTEGKASAALAAGVLRVSMGAQSFDPDRLRFLDRAHGPERIAEAFAVLRGAGYENISIDLMFGLPGQTLSEWRQDLDRALALSPDHLSCYNLTFEEGTRLTRDLRQGRVERNDEEEDRRMLLATRELLSSADFEPYEISNFAGRGGRCQHNEHYWLQGDYLGVGPGASSHRQGVRWTNLKPVEAWARAVEQGAPAAGSAETLSPRQRLGEALWLGIRRRDGVDLGAVADRLQVPIPRELERVVAALRGEGLLVGSGTHLALGEPEGLLQGDTVGARLLMP